MLLKGGQYSIKALVGTRQILKYRCHSTLIHQKQDQKVSFNKDHGFTPGNIYTGFFCKKVQFIPDFNMVVMIFEHEKTGLKYIHIDRNDSNNVFSVNFRTTPFDSTGLPHILEHNVLCGSKNFPVRDPFFKMLNRSLATFMNAMTGPDYTLYPFSSTNERDYRNLQSIYMDAVFQPNLKYLDFLQEGWRIEHKELDNNQSEYMFKGVVYNEMKGAFSENSTLFGQKMFNKLLPEHTYGYVSGGDPAEIPNLTHDDLLNFHRKYYHPSNSHILSYGNFKLENNLHYINDYLSSFDRIDNKYSEVPNQTRWVEPRKAHVTSRFDNMGAPKEKQNQIAFGFLMSDIRDIYESFLMHFITELLVKGPNSYFYKSLIEKNISGGYSQVTGYDATIKDTMFCLGLQDVNVNDFEKIEHIFSETIDQAIERGFDERHINSVIHNLELSMKHQTPKFGLGLLFSLTPIMNHNGDVVQAVNLTRQIEKLKDNIKANPKYLQEKIKEKFKENTHRLTLTMTPDDSYETKFVKQETKTLEMKVRNFTEADKQRVFEDGKALASAQRNHEDINILPCLKIEDIQTPIKFDLEFETIQNTSLQVCATNTNGVVYFRGLLDATSLSESGKKLLPLFGQILDQFGTKKLNYRDFDSLVSTKTAGLNFKVHLAENINDNKLYEIGLEVSSYALKQNSQAMFDILADLLTSVEFNDLNRFEMLLENYISALSVGIADSGHVYAMQNANGLVTESARLKESMMGIEHLIYMKQLLKEKGPENIFEEVKEIGRILLSNSPVRCALNISPADLEVGVKSVESFLQKLPIHKREIQWSKSSLLPSQCRYNIMNIPIHYCAKSVFTVPYIHKDFASLRVLGRLLSSKYLLPVVREQNGAYGAGAKISIDGLFNFFSYRDPNTLKTLETFDASNKWVEESLHKVIDEQALFEAKLGILQQLDAPVSPMDIGYESFKHGISFDIFNKHRESILATSIQDIANVAKIYLSDSNNISGISVIGRATAKEELASSRYKDWIINEHKE